tara:strand:- start:879 stop:1016 length:138 start_codon:yes stop_codon:yes gene_type:complete
MDNGRYKEGIDMFLLKRIIQKVKQWLNRSDAPKYLSGKDKGKLHE